MILSAYIEYDLKCLYWD